MNTPVKRKLPKGTVIVVHGLPLTLLSDTEIEADLTWWREIVRRCGGVIKCEG